MSAQVKAQPPLLAAMLSMTLLACTQNTAPNPDLIPTTQYEGEAMSRQWMGSFPAESDLAILLDTQMAPVIKADDRDAYGQRFLPTSWLDSVATAFESTDVEDAFYTENMDHEWRLVSARITPCAPLGILPSQNIDAYCWPAVRLVWQPVVEDHRLSWGPIVDWFADDRAIHAIYPLQPRNIYGQRIDRSLLDEVSETLQAGNLPGYVNSQAFFEQRDITSTWLLNNAYALRDPRLDDTSWSQLDLRPETQLDDDTLEAFRGRLWSFLVEFAQPEDLREMTSFSLPEGRNPAGSDIWVFVQFLAENGRIYPNDLRVMGRESGQVLAKIGPSQTVAVSVEDEAIEAALAEGNRELADSLIITGQDIAEKGEAMADPYQFLVPNTSCASCHRLNGLRFDFHSLSGFEDRGITVSPRVNKDVERDINWVRTRGL